MKIDEIKHESAKDEALMLVLKFSDLLKSIDEKLFINQIQKLNEIFEKNNVS